MVQKERGRVDEVISSGRQRRRRMYFGSNILISLRSLE